MKIMRMCDLIKSQYTNSLLALRDTRIERYITPSLRYDGGGGLPKCAEKSVWILIG